VANKALCQTTITGISQPITITIQLIEIPRLQSYGQSKLDELILDLIKKLSLELVLENDIAMSMKQCLKKT